MDQPLVVCPLNLHLTIKLPNAQPPAFSNPQWVLNKQKQADEQIAEVS
jgi:hypothetical protein